MTVKRVENREGSLEHPGFVKPVFTKDSKPLGEIGKEHLGTSGLCDTRTHLKKGLDNCKTCCVLAPFTFLYDQPCLYVFVRPWVTWWLEYRTPDRKAWVRCPMPQNTLRVHTEYVLVKSVGPKVLWAESRVQGTGEYFPPLQSHGKIVEVEIGGVAIYRTCGEFRRANSYCHLYGAQGLGQRQAYS
ncbi:uncharacterized protein TNCV_916921 [Trichonephila clavipes]|nr:uncharacterized protein TNCV_916921 [Trichonephila clavipes]